MWLFLGSRPIIALAMVVLPDPDSPTMATTSPASTDRFRPTTAWDLAVTQISDVESQDSTMGPEMPAPWGWAAESRSSLEPAGSWNVIEGENEQGHEEAGR